MDYVNVEDIDVFAETMNYPPSIDTEHLSPHPSRLVEPISVGKNCKGQLFQIPPIGDPNTHDQLFYLWFIDNKLALQQSVIEPEARRKAIITLTIDEQFLLSHFENKIPKDFFDRLHVIDFYVSDVEYTIPEARYIEHEKRNEEKHSDYAYWIVSFNNAACQ